MTIDLQAALTPATKSLAYLDKIVAVETETRAKYIARHELQRHVSANAQPEIISTLRAELAAADARERAAWQARVEYYRKAIYSEVARLAAQAARKRAATTTTTATKKRSSATIHAAFKRQRVQAGSSDTSLSVFAALGLVDVQSTNSQQPEAGEITPEQLADKELQRWLAGEGYAVHGIYLDNVMDLWASKDMKQEYPLLAAVAQSVFGSPASAAAIERDFGIAAIMLTNKRSLTDAAFVEMMLFLRANFELIPEPGCIPEISAENIKATIPSRLRTMEDIKAVEQLSQYTKQVRASVLTDSDVDVDDVDDEDEEDADAHAVVDTTAANCGGEGDDSEFI